MEVFLLRSYRRLNPNRNPQRVRLVLKGLQAVLGPEPLGRTKRTYLNQQNYRWMGKNVLGISESLRSNRDMLWHIASRKVVTVSVRLDGKKNIKEQYYYFGELVHQQTYYKPEGNHRFQYLLNLPEPRLAAFGNFTYEHSGFYTCLRLEGKESLTTAHLVHRYRASTAFPRVHYKGEPDMEKGLDLLQMARMNNSFVFHDWTLMMKDIFLSWAKYLPVFLHALQEARFVCSRQDELSARKVRSKIHQAFKDYGVLCGWLNKNLFKDCLRAVATEHGKCVFHDPEGKEKKTQRAEAKYEDLAAIVKGCDIISTIADPSLAFDIGELERKTVRILENSHLTMFMLDMNFLMRGIYDSLLPKLNDLLPELRNGSMSLPELNAKEPELWEHVFHLENSRLRQHNFRTALQTSMRILHLSKSPEEITSKDWSFWGFGTTQKISVVSDTCIETETLSKPLRFASFSTRETSKGRRIKGVISPTHTAEKFPSFDKLCCAYDSFPDRIMFSLLGGTLELFHMQLAKTDTQVSSSCKKITTIVSNFPLCSLKRIGVGKRFIAVPLLSSNFHSLGIIEYKQSLNSAFGEFSTLKEFKLNDLCSVELKYTKSRHEQTKAESWVNRNLCFLLLNKPDQSWNTGIMNRLKLLIWEYNLQTKTLEFRTHSAWKSPGANHTCRILQKGDNPHFLTFSDDWRGWRLFVYHKRQLILIKNPFGAVSLQRIKHLKLVFGEDESSTKANSKCAQLRLAVCLTGTFNGPTLHLGQLVLI